MTHKSNHTQIQTLYITLNQQQHIQPHPTTNLLPGNCHQLTYTHHLRLRNQTLQRRDRYQYKDYMFKIIQKFLNKTVPGLQEPQSTTLTENHRHRPTSLC